jgi:branched-chain amino acid transport system substrate-binding protein
MRTRTGIAVIAAGVVALGACTAGDSDTDPSSTTLVIASDLPLRGPAAPASASTNNMIRLYLEQQGNRAGAYGIKFVTYDDSSPDGSWNDASCARNAQEHVSDMDEVAVIGTYDSGCAKIAVPVLNQDPNGPMLMVSHANTNPGLTKPWNPGEPEIFYPTGERNYARVVTTDDVQGAAAAQFLAEEVKVKKCFVLNDNETYGRGVAKAFVTEAQEQDIEVLGEESWDLEASDYSELFEGISALDPDCLYVSGIYDNNGGQLLKDKVSVLGDNEDVVLMAPDGFSGIPELLAQPESEGMYLTFPGLTLETVRAGGGAGAALLEAYEEKYGEPPASAAAIYGAAAAQVVLAAIADSDGTRASITEQVLSGSGITIPADESVLGKKIVIDPETGDTQRTDISVLVVQDGAETLVTPWPAK